MTRPFDEVVHRLRRISALREARGHLAWDQETMMPPGGVEARARELSALCSVAHEMFTSETMGRRLAEAEKDVTDDRKRAVLREVRREYDRAARVPSQLVEALADATSRAIPVWTRAKARADFAAFHPVLSRIVDLRRAWAEAIDPDADPYEVLFQEYEPWIPIGAAQTVLDELAGGLGPVIEAAANGDGGPVLTGTYPANEQHRLNEAVLDLLGFDREHGRLDTSPHPFSMGNPYDARITTRYDETDPLNALSSTVHEFGHALYTLGLPKDAFGTPLGEARDLVVHESQSRFWENHVGRSRPFWEHVVPIMHRHLEQLPDDFDAEDAWQASNRVQPSLVRVDSDEITYHMHIVLRYEIEQALVRGEADVHEVPAMWNDRMDALLGLRPDDDARGCLQDIHWAHGSIGYFPTYSLGSVLAAQLVDAFEDDQGPLEDLVRDRGFGVLREWLRERVHRHGQRYTTPELIERATGQGLSAEPFLEYARGKFGAA